MILAMTRAYLPIHTKVEYKLDPPPSPGLLEGEVQKISRCHLKGEEKTWKMWKKNSRKQESAGKCLIKRCKIKAQKDGRGVNIGLFWEGKMKDGGGGIWFLGPIYRPSVTYLSSPANMCRFQSSRLYLLYTAKAEAGW